jgi:hypothetical protein
MAKNINFVEQWLRLNNMKRLLLITLILLVSFSFAKDFEIVAKPGTLFSREKAVLLYCGGIFYEPCIFNIALKDGVYLYISETLRDTVSFIVDSQTAYILRKKDNSEFRIYKQ